MTTAKLVLEDGTYFEGYAFGALGNVTGEIVFHTGMTGYQEVLTDPSYAGQIVTMTYPHIGNYGITRDDDEANRPAVHGFVVRQHSEITSNWRAKRPIGSWLQQWGIVGISGVDTRMITRIIRSRGTMRALLSTQEDVTISQLLDDVRQSTVIQHPVAQVSTPQMYRCNGTGLRIVLVDFGAKGGIVRELIRRQCDVVVVPHNTTAEQVMALSPDGVLLSNGPGDPNDVPYAVAMVREIIGRIPLFGICLGHQLFALACGATTSKLAFGHRGSNHPVRDLQTGQCYITSQNHGYTVNADSIAPTRLAVSQINNNDLTIEGLRHLDAPAFSVQYHPEASPGPDDSNYLFDTFLDMVRTYRHPHTQQEAN